MGFMLMDGLGWQLAAMMMAVVVLVKATSMVAGGLSVLVLEVYGAKFGLVVVLMAMLTGLPELFVGIGAAVEGVPSLALGNVVGSNIANLSIVVGGAALLGGSIAVLGSYAKDGFIYAFLIGSLPLLLLFDRGLSRVDGVILVLVYAVYLYLTFWGRPRRAVEVDLGEMSGFVFRRLKKRLVRRPLIQATAGMVLILVAAEVIVNTGAALAVGLNVPVLLVGLFVVAVGTSLPELALWIMAAARREAAVVFGNLLGSIAANSTLVIGITAVISPIRVAAMESYLMATLAYVVIFWLFWILTRTKRRLDRWEGTVLVAVYLMFLGVELGRGGYVRDIWRWLAQLLSW